MSEFRIPTMTKRVELTNLAIDGSFEDALNNWNCWLAEPTDTSQAKDGSRSLKLGGDALAGSKAAVSLVSGHKYYGREYLKTAGELTAADCRFELCGAVDGVEKSFVFGWNRGNYPDWTAISDVITADGAYDFGLRTFTVGGSVDAWVDCITVIDLTAACGAGNEPTKEWCDANIPYFSGSYEVDIPVSTPIQKLVTGLTIPEGVVTQITDASGRVIWSAIKEVGTIILRPSADISVGHELYPTDSTAAYLLINEEVSDTSSTYIRVPETADESTSSTISTTSKFKLSNVGTFPNKRFVVTSVNINGDNYCIDNVSNECKNEFNLEIGGAQSSTVTSTSDKDEFDLPVIDAIPLINEAIANNGILPDINLNITSYAYAQTSGNKVRFGYSGVTQVYVVLAYEA